MLLIEPLFIRIIRRLPAGVKRANAFTIWVDVALTKVPSRKNDAAHLRPTPTAESVPSACILKVTGISALCKKAHDHKVLDIRTLQLSMHGV